MRKSCVLVRIMRLAIMRIFIGCLILVSVFLGCTPQQGAHQQWKRENGKLKILTTIEMIDDLVKQIGGEHVDSMPLICKELDPHSYELVKGDDEKFLRADLIFYNGLGLEHGLSLRQNLENNQKAIGVTDCIVNNSPELVLSMNGQSDPHVWMDVSLWALTVDPILEALCQKDPLHAEEFIFNATCLKERLSDLDASIYTILQQVPEERRYLVTSHDAFHYFVRRYFVDSNESDWKKRSSAPEGLAPDVQMSVSDVIEIVSHIKTFGVKVLFPESNVSQDSLRKIVNAAKHSGFEIHLSEAVLYGDSMGQANSYEEMITHNAEVIARELCL